MKIIDFIFKIFFPARCPMCGEVAYEDDKPCDKCQATSRMIEPPLCVHCGREKGTCGCGSKRHLYSSIVMPYHYDGAVKSGIYRLKYEDRPMTERFFAEKMSELVSMQYSNIKFDIITSVPMHKNKIKTRKYNPPARLADYISKRLNVPFQECIIKIYDGKEQHKLKAVERKGNVLGAYEMKEGISVSGKIILLCDDIITTGSTLDECAKILRLAGAKQVYAVVCAGAVKIINDKNDRTL